MKKTLYVLLIFLILLNLTGREAVRKKFTRKKKPPVKTPHIYQVKKYEKRPTPDLYKKHYAFWMSWHSELLRVLGQNKKKDKRCVEEILSNLKDMRSMLISRKSDELTPHIEKLSKVKDIIFEEDLTTYNKDYVKRALEREERAIKREFNFKKIKDYLKENFDGESQSAK